MRFKDCMFNPGLSNLKLETRNLNSKPMKDLRQIIDSYNPTAPLAEASTIPSAWYTDERVFELEQHAVFGSSWQVAGRFDQLREPGNYVTTEIAAEPIVIVRGT